MNPSNIIEVLALSLPGFLLAIVFHEAAHAWMATKFGDNTAASMGRLSLNPAVHYDLVGTVIFPLIGIMIGGIPFGWAKPVPVDPRRFTNMKMGMFWVSFAGPAANILLAVISAIVFAIFYTQVPADFYLRGPFIQMAEKSVLINIILAVFNLIPFPPLDGSKMLAPFLNYEMGRKFEELQRYTFVFILLLWFTNIFSYIMRPALYAGYKLINTLVGLMG